jgi:hypothetical protein
VTQSRAENQLLNPRQCCEIRSYQSGVAAAASLGGLSPQRYPRTLDPSVSVIDLLGTTATQTHKMFVGHNINNFSFFTYVSRDSSVGVVTRYGLEVSGIESGLGRGFPHLPRPALGPTPPPVRLVPVLFPGCKAAGARR